MIEIRIRTAEAKYQETPPNTLLRSYTQFGLKRMQRYHLRIYVIFRLGWPIAQCAQAIPRQTHKGEPKIMPSNGNRSPLDLMAVIAKKMRAIESAMLETSDAIRRNDTDVNEQDRRMQKRIANAHAEKGQKQNEDDKH